MSLASLLPCKCKSKIFQASLQHRQRPFRTHRWRRLQYLSVLYLVPRTVNLTLHTLTFQNKIQDVMPDSYFEKSKQFSTPFWHWSLISDAKERNFSLFHEQQRLWQPSTKAAPRTIFINSGVLFVGDHRLGDFSIKIRGWSPNGDSIRSQFSETRRGVAQWRFHCLSLLFMGSSSRGRIFDDLLLLHVVAFPVRFRGSYKTSTHQIATNIRLYFRITQFTWAAENWGEYLLDLRWHDDRRQQRWRAGRLHGSVWSNRPLFRCQSRHDNCVAFCACTIFLMNHQTQKAILCLPNKLERVVCCSISMRRHNPPKRQQVLSDSVPVLLSWIFSAEANWNSFILSMLILIYLSLCVAVFSKNMLR